MNRILFDASSTNPISELIAVAPGDCVLLNSWGLNVGEIAQVYRALVALGNIPAQQSGSCVPPPQVTPALIQNETPYFPCNLPVQLGEANQSLTSLVIQQPGFYRVHLSPSALGTAYVEAVVLTGEEACAGAARECCCLPETFWQGASLNPCLVITPGGDAGHAPTFDIDACCLLQAFPALPVPLPTDELVVLSGGQCFRSTIAQVFDPAIICTTLGSYLLQLPVAGDTLVTIGAGLSCKRTDGETFVQFFETPWTGISITPALTIAPGGVNGHGPTFAYDLCADLQAIPSCVCEPAPGDLVPIIQGGACVLATWPTVDVCDQIGVLPNGAPVVGDRALIREAGGLCKLVDPTVYAIPFDGGIIATPILAANGSCASPAYSFTISPDSGVWFDPAVGPSGAVVVSDHNCTNRINVGASVEVLAPASDVLAMAGSPTTNGARLHLYDLATNSGIVELVGANSSPGFSPGATFVSGGLDTHGFGGALLFLRGGNSTVVGGDVLISGGGGPAGGNIVLTAGASGDISLQTPGASNAVSLVGTAGVTSLHVGSSSNNVIIRTGSTVRWVWGSDGSVSVSGSAGVAGERLTSQGPGLPPIWAV